MWKQNLGSPVQHLSVKTGLTHFQPNIFSNTFLTPTTQIASCPAKLVILPIDAVTARGLIEMVMSLTQHLQS